MAEGGGRNLNLGDGLVEESSSLLYRFPIVDALVSEFLTPKGFEVYPFHIGWYNELVGPRFYLDYPANTVGLVVLSGPETFEKCVVPFIKAQVTQETDLSTFDPLDGSMKHSFDLITTELLNKGIAVEPIQDFEYHPNRKPKVLVQTAAHVAGAVEYFHRDRLQSNKGPLWLEDSKLFGVAIHPQHGGWFAIRGVLILKNLVLDNENALPKPDRPIVVDDDNKIATLLEEFGLRWKTNEWRDIIPGKLKSKYSTDFIEYLATEPENRWKFIKEKGLLQDMVTCERTI